MQAPIRKSSAKVLCVLAVCAVIAGCLSAGPAGAAGGFAKARTFKDPSKIKIPELGEIQTPEIERHVLENGMIVYLLENHEFPLVDFRAMVKVGAMYEPAHLRGLAGVTGAVLRTGGTLAIPGDELDERLESMGAYIESSIRDTEGSISASFLSENSAQGLQLVADLMRQPAFPEEKIDLAKIDERTSISSRNDEPIPIASREFRKLIYGADSPYGWHTEYETIAAITREDLVAFHARFFHPDRTIFAVSGDFDPGEMLAQIQAVFGDWAPAAHALPPDPPVPPTGPRGVYFAPKENVTQSTVFFGLMGTLASDPDYAALQLINQILGSGFTSRLVNEIRTKRGLAYAVGSGPGTGWHHPGVWACYLLTQADSTITASQAMMSEVRKIVREPVTEQELQGAKDIVLNELIFALSSEREVLARKMRYEFLGYPQDFLETYQRRIKELTAHDLLDAARRHIHPEQIAVIIVGPREEFDAPLETLGEVTEIDITIPDPPAVLTVADPTPEALARGAELMRRAYEAHGGPALVNLKSIREIGKGQMSAMGQKMNFTLETVRELPDRSYAKIVIGGMFTIERIGDGDQGWTKTPQGVMERAPAEAEEARMERLRTPHLFLPKHGELTWQAIGLQEFAGESAEAVYARDSAVKEWMIYLDPASGLIRGMRYRGKGEQGPVEVTEFHRDHRVVSGIPMPFAVEIQHAGETFLTVQTETAEVNVPVDEALFQKP
jgi:zinc protease